MKKRYALPGKNSKTVDNICNSKTVDNIRSLITDPIFQLNTFLWSLMEVPVGNEVNVNINPFLRKLCYRLYALEKKVVLPTDPGYVEAITPLVPNIQGSPIPDLWLKHKTDSVEIIIELKAHSFGLNTRQATQITKIISASEDLSLSVGGGPYRPGHVIVVTLAEDMSRMAETLNTIGDSLRQVGVKPSRYGVMGWQESSNGVRLICLDPDQLPLPLKEEMTDPITVINNISIADDLAPLYFIPWMPGIEAAQDGLRELTERLLIHTLSIIGNAEAPSLLEIDGGSVLNEATFGIFRFWRDRDRRRFIQEAIRVIHKAIKQGDFAKNETILRLNILNEEVRYDLLDRIERFKTDDIETNLSQAAEPTLFDELLE